MGPLAVHAAYSGAISARALPRPGRVVRRRRAAAASMVSNGAMAVTAAATSPPSRDARLRHDARRPGHGLEHPRDPKKSRPTLVGGRGDPLVEPLAGAPMRAADERGEHRDRRVGQGDLPLAQGGHEDHAAPRGPHLPERLGGGAHALARELRHARPVRALDLDPRGAGVPDEVDPALKGEQGPGADAWRGLAAATRSGSGGGGSSPKGARRADPSSRRSGACRGRRSWRPPWPPSPRPPCAGRR